MNPLQPDIIFFLFFSSLFLVIFGLLIKSTGGLFWARPFEDFFQDRYDPKFKEERRIGLKLSNILLTYVPPVSIFLFFLFFLSLLNKL